MLSLFFLILSDNCILYLLLSSFKVLAYTLLLLLHLFLALLLGLLSDTFGLFGGIGLLLPADAGWRTMQIPTKALGTNILNQSTVTLTGCLIAQLEALIRSWDGRFFETWLIKLALPLVLNLRTKFRPWMATFLMINRNCLPRLAFLFFIIAINLISSVLRQLWFLFIWFQIDHIDSRTEIGVIGI